MPRGNFPVYSMNGGEVGREALARFDLDRLRYAATLQDNFFPEVIGSMRMRSGFEFLDSYTSTDGIRLVPFVVSGATKYLLVFEPTGMRIMQDGEFLESESVSTTIQNGDFSSFTGWSDESTGSASAGVSGGNLVLTGASNAFAIARQSVSVAPADETTAHSIRINVVRGPVSVRIGSTAGANDILNAGGLEEGEHMLTFTPNAATFYLDMFTGDNRNILVDEAQIVSGGDIVVDHPWAGDDLASLRYDQSQDVIFVSSQGYQQRRIERRGDRSWSIVRYKTENGPFDVSPETSITVAPSVTQGVGTFTASEGIFSASDVGSLLRLTHSQQLVSDTFSAPGQTSDSIRITGVGTTARSFVVSVDVDGAWAGTITLEQSIGVEGDWSTFRTYTADDTDNINDGLDNQIVFYRLNVTAHTAGTATVSLRYNGGTTQGVGRIVGFTSPTVVDMEVLEPFGSTDGTVQWDRGSWSDRNGWPNTVALHDGRLWWGRGDTVFGSESDRFTSYSTEITGDAAPIIRSIGAGPEQGTVWLLSLQRLLVGTDISEISVRASSFDEPLTASAFVPRRASTRGCANIAPVEIDSSGIFVQRSGSRVFDAVFDGGAQDYVSRDLTELHTEICAAGVVSIAVQRQPDTRVWFVLGDGTVRVLTYEPSENVVAWSRVTTDGTVEDVQVLPSTGDDEVYIAINRSAGRFIERLANYNVDALRIADSYQIDAGTPGSPRTVITGLDRLNGKDVIVWADSGAVVDQSNMLTVTGGQITLPSATDEDLVIGLPYVARWTSTKLAYGAAQGTALSQYKKVDHLGMYLLDFVPAGIRIGRDFDNLTALSRNDRGQPIPQNEIKADQDVDLQEFNGEIDVDSRVNIQVSAPYPATIAALVIAMKTNDR